MRELAQRIETQRHRKEEEEIIMETNPESQSVISNRQPVLSLNPEAMLEVTKESSEDIRRAFSRMFSLNPPTQPRSTLQ